MSYGDTKAAKDLKVGDLVSYQGLNGQIVLTVAQIIREKGWVNVRLEHEGHTADLARWRPNKQIPIPATDRISMTKQKNPEDDVPLLSTGDVNAFEYGGGILYYQPKYNEFLWVFWDGPADDDEDALENYIYRVYMFRYEPGEDLFARPHGSLDWVEKELDSIASSVGMSEDELRRLGKAQPLEKWVAAEAVKGYWGPDNLDHDPYEATYTEMEKRYGDDLDKLARRNYNEAVKIWEQVRAPNPNSSSPNRKLKNKLMR